MSVASRIGQYRILREIGAGGMGTVFLGEHMLLKRCAAIKALRPALSAQRAVVDRFFNEARATSAISDPGVVQIFDFGYHVDGTAFIVMEFLDGESLADRIDRLGHLSIGAALRIARQLAVSLAAAHVHGIVHRDLKPENVFVCPDPEAQGGERTKILDFGICKTPGDGDPGTTMTGEMLGTPVYMSPEQCRGQKGVDHRADIYALGGVLFHMLTGRPPFEAEGIGEYIAAHLREHPPVPSSLIFDLPPSIDLLITRCLQKQPEDRFQSMLELQVAIDDVLAELVAAGYDSQAGRASPALAEPADDDAEIVVETDEDAGATVAGVPESLSALLAEGTPEPGPAPVPSMRAPLFVFTPTPVPVSTTLGGASGQIALEQPRRSRLWTLLALFAVLGAITGFVVIGRDRGDHDEAQAQPARPAAALDRPDPAPVEAAAVPAAPAATPAAAPEEPVAAAADPAPTPATPKTAAAAAAVTRPAKAPAANKSRPRKRAMSRPAPRSASTQAEDLYDTR